MSVLSFLGKVFIGKIIINELDVLFSKKLFDERIMETRLLTEKIRKQIIKTRRLNKMLKDCKHEDNLPLGILEIRKMWKNRNTS